MAYTDALAKQFYNLAGTSAPRFGAAGEDAMTQASNYFKTLLGGSRGDIMRAIAPANESMRASADAAKKEQARKGTARTGGTAEANQQVEDEVRKQVATLVGNLQQGAAGQLGSLGEPQIKNMLDTLSTGLSSAQSDINSRRQASAAMWSSLIGGAASLATAPLGGTLLGKVI